jgi:hypothetical protein
MACCPEEYITGSDLRNFTTMLAPIYIVSVFNRAKRGQAKDDVAVRAVMFTNVLRNQCYELCSET